MDFLPETFVCPLYVKFQDENGEVFWGFFESPDQKEAQVIEGDITTEWKATNTFKKVHKILAPVPNAIPPTIYGMALNYKQYLDELKIPKNEYPVIFIKNPCSICNPGEVTYVPTICQNPSEAFMEMEIAVILKKTCINVSVEEAKDYILGYTICNDGTAEHWQNWKGGSQWTFSKSFDTFTPMGPTLVLQEDFEKHFKQNGFHLEGYINGIKYPDCSSTDMLTSFQEVISFISQNTTILAGTVILTGTPGNNPVTKDPPVYLEDGDKLEMKVENVGTLHNTISWAPLPVKNKN